MMEGLWLLMPVAVVVSTALLTRRILLSLFLGVCIASLASAKFNPFEAFKLGLYRFLEQTGIVDLFGRTGSYGAVYLVIFIALLGVLIELLTHTGGLRVYTEKLLRRIKNKQQSQIFSLSTAFLFFLDDYLGAFMVGSLSIPITDKFAVPRAKLAYLINSVTSPLTVLIPASSWVAMILTQFESVGVGDSAAAALNFEPFYLYLTMIPFLIYPILSVFSAYFIVWKGISFGKMRSYEKRAEKDGNLFGGKRTLDSFEVKEVKNYEIEPSIWDIFLPIGIFFLVFVFALLYSGGFFLLGGTNNFLKTLMVSESAFALGFAVLASVLSSTILFFLKKRGDFKDLAWIYWRGFMLMQGALLMLFLAGALSSILRYDLGTSAYVSKVFSGSISVSLLPVIIFLISTLLSASTGSAWGSIMFLIPLVLPLIGGFWSSELNMSLAFFVAPGLGALVSGAIAGSHMSPITNAMVVSALGAKSYHLDHAVTQIAYSIPVVVASIFSFSILGLLYFWSFWVKFLVSLLAGLFAYLALIWLRSDQKN